MAKASKAPKKATTPKKLTASQRITALEEAVGITRTNDEMIAQEINSLRQSFIALSRRLNAIIKSGETGNISNDSVNSIITEENVVELEGKVKLLLEKNAIVKSETGEIKASSFVVGRELDKDSNVINPRIQFAVQSITPEAQESVLGKTLGDVIENNLGDGLSLEVTEVYDIPTDV
jgi:hypothetical protein